MNPHLRRAMLLLMLDELAIYDAILEQGEEEQHRRDKCKWDRVATELPDDPKSLTVPTEEVGH